MKIKTILITIVSIILILIIANYLIFNVAFLATTSVLGVCYPDTADRGNVISLAETVTTFNATTGEKEITVTYFLPPTERTIKHEYVHVHQSQRPIWFSASCVFPLQKFIREVEAYVASDLPNPIYQFIYGYDPTDPDILEV